MEQAVPLATLQLALRSRFITRLADLLALMKPGVMSPCRVHRAHRIDDRTGLSRSTFCDDCNSRNRSRGWYRPVR